MVQKFVSGLNQALTAAQHIQNQLGVTENCSHVMGV